GCRPIPVTWRQRRHMPRGVARWCPGPVRPRSAPEQVSHRDAGADGGAVGRGADRGGVAGWKARVAVFGIFVLNGIIIGAWSARVPAIARQAHASPGALGLAMLGASIGLVIAASLAGRLCAAF